MPRTLNVDFRKESEAQFSGEAVVVFLTISHGTLADPIRVNWDTKDFVYDGNTYIGFPFALNILTDDESPPKAQLQIQNIDPRIGDTLRTLITPPRLKIEVLSTLDFDLTADPRTEIGSPGATVIYSADKLFLINASVDFLTVTAEIVGWDYLQRVWPGVRATQAYFPGLFR
jgi:hypothetical protein